MLIRFAFLFTSLVSTATECKALPNILFILADDLGWGNVGYHNQNGEVYTPNIDYLVSNGLELNRHYAHYVCSPTRSSVHSGRLPFHCNLSNGEASAESKYPVGIPSNYTIIAEKLKYQSNYSTHYVGKWHSGAALFSQMPFGRGYDTHFGYLWGENDYWNQDFQQCDNANYDLSIVDLWNYNQSGIKYNNTGYEEFLFSQRVYDLLDSYNDNDNENDEPFYLFYAPHLSHSPLSIPEEYLTEYDNDEYLCCNFTLRYNKNNHKPNPVYPGYNKTCEEYHCRSIYQSMVNLFDIIIGNITTKLQSKNNFLWNNTLIIFSSDNGGQLTLDETAANNYPMRGGKFVPLEGGIRVNAFVSGGYLPNIQRGKKTDEIIHICDWYSTICSIVGINSTDIKAAKAGLPPIDSINQWDLISGITNVSKRNEIIVDHMTLIQNDYKYINSTGVEFTADGCKKNQICYASWSGNLSPNTTSMQHPISGSIIDCNNNGCLFDVKNDFTEHNNLVNQSEYQNIVSNMNQRLNELRKTYYSNNEAGTDLCPSNTSISCSCYMAINQYQGFWGPYRYP